MTFVQVVQRADGKWHVEELEAPHRIPVPPDATAHTQTDGTTMRRWTAAQWLTDAGCARCVEGRCVQRIEAYPAMDVVTHDCAASLN